MSLLRGSLSPWVWSLQTGRAQDPGGPTGINGGTWFPILTPQEKAARTGGAPQSRGLRSQHVLFPFPGGVTLLLGDPVAWAPPLACPCCLQPTPQAAGKGLQSTESSSQVASARSVSFFWLNLPLSCHETTSPSPGLSADPGQPSSLSPGALP